MAIVRFTADGMGARLYDASGHPLEWDDRQDHSHVSVSCVARLPEGEYWAIENTPWHFAAYLLIARTNRRTQQVFRFWTWDIADDHRPHRHMPDIEKLPAWLQTLAHQWNGTPQTAAS